MKTLVYFNVRKIITQQQLKQENKLNVNENENENENENKKLKKKKFKMLTLKN